MGSVTKALIVVPDLTTFLRWCKERGGGIEAAREKGVMLIGNTVLFFDSGNGVAAGPLSDGIEIVGAYLGTATIEARKEYEEGAFGRAMKVPMIPKRLQRSLAHSGAPDHGKESR